LEGISELVSAMAEIAVCAEDNREVSHANAWATFEIRKIARNNILSRRQKAVRPEQAGLSL
jgi:hypothetical protein